MLKNGGPCSNEPSLLLNYLEVTIFVGLNQHLVFFSGGLYFKLKKIILKEAVDFSLKAHVLIPKSS